jgi:hypothetical protein
MANSRIQIVDANKNSADLLCHCLEEAGFKKLASRSWLEEVCFIKPSSDFSCKSNASCCEC